MEKTKCGACSDAGRMLFEMEREMLEISERQSQLEAKCRFLAAHLRGEAENGCVEAADILAEVLLNTYRAETDVNRSLKYWEAFLYWHKKATSNEQNARAILN